MKVSITALAHLQLSGHVSPQQGCSSSLNAWRDLWGEGACLPVDKAVVLQWPWSSISCLTVGPSIWNRPLIACNILMNVKGRSRVGAVPHSHEGKKTQLPPHGDRNCLLLCREPVTQPSPSWGHGNEGDKPSFSTMRNLLRWRGSISPRPPQSVVEATSDLNMMEAHFASGDPSDKKGSNWKVLLGLYICLTQTLSGLWVD
jgi:hypothetical protein